MKRFMLKCVLLCAALFIGVLMGMQKANVSMVEMKGYHDERFKSPLTFEERENGEVEASVLGKNVSSHDLEKKHEKLKEIHAFNFFSSLGKTIANIISSLTEKVIQLISSFI
ncbi:hypothetical protein B5V89_03120 [Heyndrickxia sporothermodurans]|uniref:YqxA family protein n=1 Tax=Heyndrickxia sporothermodurans TaxID=46224 RepID=UPI000D3C4F4E|nr:YqxA family protein [Heyndrickxia sporothermodurans]PTY80291.1 hypothetical protein B5V89_03120 [Heyndrickxia sporothermodurans]